MNKGVNVYHYTSIEVLKKILLSQRLRFTKMNSLNDKSEYKYGIQLLKNKIIEYETNNNICSRFDINLLDKFSFSDKLYSISFTENGDDLAFWNSYYVDKISPISIVFKSDNVFSNNDFKINHCIYDNPYPLMGKARYEWFKQIFEIRNIMQISKNHEYIHITFQTAHIKQKAFEIEKEWRAVSFGSKNGSFGKFVKNNKEVDYFDQPFNVESICEIIVGPSIQQEQNYQEVTSLISNRKLKILVKKSTIPIEL
jgi:hypothetical protein